VAVAVSLIAPPTVTADAAALVDAGLVGAELVVAGGAYAAGQLRAHVSPARAQAFLLGLATVAVALVSPLDGAADRAMAPHMVQHVLLVAVAAPLLVLGRPLLVYGTLLPGNRRRSVVRRGAAVTRACRGAGWWLAAAAAVGLHTAVMLLWHVPALYAAAVHHEALHAVEHASLLAVACLLWWVLLGAGRREAPAGSVLVLFASALPLTLLGVALVLASTNWYPGVAVDLADQQLAGAVLWGACGTVTVAQGAGLFAWWLATTGTTAGEVRRAAGRPNVPGPAGTPATR